MSLDEKKPELEEIEHYDEKPSSPAHHAANGETKGVFNAAFAEATAETLNPYSKCVHLRCHRRFSCSEADLQLA